MTKTTNFQKFIKKHKAAILAFIQKHKNDCPNQSDWWISFSEDLELQFCVNEDEKSPNFNLVEVWAYAVIDGEIETRDDNFYTLFDIAE